MWAGFNVYLAANMFREAASLTTQIQGETIPTDKPGALSMTVRQPVGVMPQHRALERPGDPGGAGHRLPDRLRQHRGASSASEASPRTHRLVGKRCVEAGLPPGVLNVMTNAPQDAPEMVDALIAHPAVRRINFTGSTRVGRIIAQKAGHAAQAGACSNWAASRRCVVLDDADIDEAVNAAVFGAFLYQGQICMSTERIVVDESIADEFVAKFAREGQGIAGRRPDPERRLRHRPDDRQASPARV